MANSFVVVIVGTLLVYVTADGYPNDAPAAMTPPQETSTPVAAPPEASSTLKSSAGEALTPPSPPPVPQHGVAPTAWLSSLYPALYTGQYPAVSTDYVSRYYGPVALPVVLPDGTIADTPEVAAARGAHLAALAKAKALWYGPKDDGSYDPWKHAYVRYHPTYLQQAVLTSGATLNTPYFGPQATPTVLPSGYLQDTPATAALRAAHLSALARARAEAAFWRKAPHHHGWN